MRTFPSVLFLVHVSNMLVLKSSALCNQSILLTGVFYWKHLSLQCKLRHETCLLNSQYCSVYQQQRVLEQRGKKGKNKKTDHFCELLSLTYSRCGVFLILVYLTLHINSHFRYVIQIWLFSFIRLFHVLILTNLLWLCE